MKVLFVGEGKNDIGAPGFAVPLRQATGFLFLLARKICPIIAEDSLAIYWREISIFNPSKKRNIYAARVLAAAALASRNGCDAVVIVVDREYRDENRLKDMLTAFEPPVSKPVEKPFVICGEAILSIEAWALGAPSAIAHVLEMEKETILRLYKPSRAEDMNPRSEKPDNNSKKMLDRIAGLGHLEDDTAFREAIASHVDVDELSRHCDKGFKPFMERLRRVFGPSVPSP